MIENKSVTAIILVAGNSSRYGKNRNKNFERINGKTILSYSLNEFNKNENIDDIIVDVKTNEISIVQEILQEENLNKNIKIINGGKDRKESVYNCIKSTNSDIVIIHDGARPLIKQEYINKCVGNMEQFDGVTIGVKSKDTIKITNKDNVVIETTKRCSTWVIQTPQCFNRKTLIEAHEECKDEEITDDCVLLENCKHKVKVIEGEYTNIKITTYEDLNIVKQFLN